MQKLFNGKLQNVFDLQKNIIILTGGKQLLMANRVMFDFFGFKDIHDFLQHHTIVPMNSFQNESDTPAKRNGRDTVEFLQSIVLDFTSSHHSRINFSNIII